MTSGSRLSSTNDEQRNATANTAGTFYLWYLTSGTDLEALSGDVGVAGEALVGGLGRLGGELDNQLDLGDRLGVDGASLRIVVCTWVLAPPRLWAAAGEVPYF